MKETAKNGSTLAGWKATAGDDNTFVTISADEDQLREYMAHSHGWSSIKLRKRTLTVDGVKFEVFIMVSVG